MTIALAGDDITDNRVSALVISMSYLSTVDISCLRVSLTKLRVLILLVSVFLRYTWISGIDGFLSLPSSIRGAFLGHTKFGNSSESSHSPNLRMSPTIVVSIIIMHDKILFIPNGLSCPISCTS